MGFLCKNKGDKTIVSISDINNQELKRDLGLSNIYNVNTTTNFCFEGFNGPTYGISGATKPTVGLTSGCTSGVTDCYAVYNLSELDNFTLTFNLSGSTDYTGYTGSFCYKMFPRGTYIISDPLLLETVNVINNLTPIRERCVPFSLISGDTITDNVSIASLPISDNDIMIRTYYQFSSKKCSVGSAYNTWNSVTQFNQFDFDNDWYFITTIEPSEPYIIKEAIDTLEQSEVRQQRYSPPGPSTTIKLDTNPAGTDVLFFMNGVVKLVYIVSPQSQELVNGSPSQDLFKIDQFKVTGFTSGLTASTTNIVNNTPIGTQEIYLQEDFNPTDTMMLFVNGVSLLEGTEYFKSRTSNNRIILNPDLTEIRVGDMIVVWYFKTRSIFNGDLGSLDTDSVTIKWGADPFIQPAFNNGRFIVEIKYEEDDWDTLYASDTTEQITNQTSYNLTFSNLDLKKKYNYRIVFEKTYLSQLNNDVITKSYSDEGRFDTMRDDLYYSY
jgi:hypothetical protein